MVDKTKIDLACGNNKKEGYFGVDIVNVPGVDLVHDLNVYPYPFEDNSVEKINCSHYMEHIKHDDVLLEIKNILNKTNSFGEFKNKVLSLEKPLDGVIKFINEVYRILKPGGKITITCPYAMHSRAFGDPTHARYIHDISFYYFNKEWRDLNKLAHYGIDADFDIKFSYFIDESLTLKSEEVRQVAFTKDWNSILDIIVELVKRDDNINNNKK